MTDWEERLDGSLVPVLMKPDPRPDLSAYHDMPYAVFRYPPEAELEVRRKVALLVGRLETVGKRVTSISLAECMEEALAAEGLDTATLVDAETSVGLEATVETVHQVLAEYQPLDRLVAARVPDDADPLRDVVFLVRAGALFPVYRTSSLLEQLKGKLRVPAVLFYPGQLDGAAGLRFMGVLDAEHNYRPRIF